MFRLLALVAAATLTLSACDSADPLVETPIRARVAQNVVADPATRNPTNGQVSATGRFTLYSLRDSSVVLSYDNPVRTDSATTRWDIGFNGTDIIVNGGTSGPGQGAAAVVVGTFDSFTSVPDSVALRVDDATTLTCPAVRGAPGASYAICRGSDNGWFNYNRTQNLVTPLPGRTILVRTADGQGYAKLQIQSYYRDAPAVPITVGGPNDSPDRTYTFQYVLNPAGRQFTTLQ